MLVFQEFSAWVEIDGVPVEEHGIAQSQNSAGIPTVTCWIVSEVGKQFKVFWKDSVASTATAGDLFVDGQFAESPINRAGTTSKTIVMDGFRTSVTEVKTLIFSAIQLTDDDDYLHSAASPDLGDIKVRIGRIILEESYVPPLRQHEPNQPIHERAKKAVVHQVGAGPSIAKSTTYWKTKKLGTAVEFIFKYRSRDQLIANDIIPAPVRDTNKRTAPSDDADVLEVSDSSDEEAKAEALLAAVRAKRAKKRIKREVKEEPDIKPVLSGQVIDLT